MKTLQNKINTYKKGFLFVSIFILCYACSDLLDEDIDNRVLINTLDKMQDALDGLNSRADFLFTDYMSDDYEFRDVAGYVNRTAMDDIGNYFTFRVTKESLPRNQYKYSFYYSNPNLSWLRYYYRIQNSVLVLDAAIKYELKSESEEVKRNTIIAQAKAIRAYCHFMLLNLFAKPYDPATASNDLGIPLVENYTGKATETYPRKTVKEEYDFIEQELLKAHKLIDDKLIGDKKSFQFHFTQINIEALLARLYLYKKEWKKCIEFANKVIDKKPGKLVDVQALTAQYVAQESKWDDFSKHYFDPDEQESYLLMSEDTNHFQSYWWSGYYPWALKRFLEQNGKTRAQTYYLIWSSPLFGDIMPMKLLYFRDSPTGRWNGTFPLLSVDETYYNRAEAYIENGQLDKAKEDLKLLVAKDAFIKKEEDGSISQDQAFINKLTNIHDKKELMNYLLDAKRMRFYGEGMRWFDIRRHGLPVTHTNNAGTFTIDGSDPQAYVIMPPLEELDFGGNEYK